MSWQNTSPEVFQALKAQKALLSRLSPNRAAVAELVGVRPSSVEGWCNVQQMNPHMPLALVSRHPEARELLEYHAYQIGYTLVPIPAADRRNGGVSDELLSSMKDLGTTAEGIQSALKDFRTPGRIDAEEARQIRQVVRQLQQDVTDMITELDAIADGEIS